jgi:hypothetical protein
MKVEEFLVFEMSLDALGLQMGTHNNGANDR